MAARTRRRAGRAAVQPDTFDTAAKGGELKVSCFGFLGFKMRTVMFTGTRLCTFDVFFE